MHKFPFWAIILKYATSIENIEERLVYQFCKYENKSENTIKRKIRLWKYNYCQPVNRLELIKICFALSLTSQQASLFLKDLGEYGLNKWNKQELIYMYCLDHHIPFETIKFDLKQANYPLKKSNNLNLITTSQSLDELVDKIEQHSDYFGLFPLKVYEKFKKRLDTLKKPVDNPKYSYKKIMDEYLRIGIPYRRNIKSYNLEMKNIKKNWPNEKTLRMMYNRQLAVSRKMYILVYLTTNEPNIQKLNMELECCNLGCLNQDDLFEDIVISTIKTYDQDNEYYLEVLKQHISKYFQK